MIEILGTLVIALMLQAGIPMRAAERAVELGDEDAAGLLFFGAFFPVAGPIIALLYLLAHLGR
jgi:hypothetical protein